jgi:hypothetical protein
MKTASAIICLIGALLGLVTSLFTLLTGGTASLFAASGAQEMVDFGWVGLACSLLIIVTAALTFRSTSPAPPILSALLGSIGIVFGGTFTAIALLLALIGGCIGALAPEASPVPAGVRGWSWGALFFGWIWAVFNRVWIGLLTLVPGFGLILAIILAIKGREWAWASRSWDSVEHFQRVQRRWNLWGIFVGVGIFMISLAAGIVVPDYQHYRQSHEPAAHPAQNAASAMVPKAAPISPSALTIPEAMRILFGQVQVDDHRPQKDVSIMPDQIHPRWAFPLTLKSYTSSNGVPETILLYQSSSIRHAADAYQAASAVVGAAIFAWSAHHGWRVLQSEPVITRLGGWGRTTTPKTLSIGYRRPGFLFADGSTNQGTTTSDRVLLAPVHNRLQVVFQIMRYAGEDSGQCGPGTFSPCYSFQSRMEIDARVATDPWYPILVRRSGTMLGPNFQHIVSANRVQECHYTGGAYHCRPE